MVINALKILVFVMELEDGNGMTAMMEVMRMTVRMCSVPRISGNAKTIKDLPNILGKIQEITLFYWVMQFFF